MKADETKIYGQHACRTLFACRPFDIIRVLLDADSAKTFGELLKHCAAEHLPYRVVSREELEKVSGARHHEGICVVASPRRVPSLDEVLVEEGPGLILALDQVSNPHNVGTLLRTAAHFGVRAVLIGGKMRRLSSAAYRTAEGAAEYVDVIFEDDLGTMLDACKKAGFAVCATSSHKGVSLYEGALAPRSVIMLGAERDGLSAKLMQDADALLMIPGTAQVESLNVASSAAVLLAEHWRQHPGAARS